MWAGRRVGCTHLRLDTHEELEDEHAEDAREHESEEEEKSGDGAAEGTQTQAAGKGLVVLCIRHGRPIDFDEAAVGREEALACLHRAMWRQAANHAA